MNETLLIAAEECAEVTQMLSKVLRFGLHAQHPNEDVDNQDRLEEEIGDLMCMFEIMAEQNIIDWGKVSVHSRYKRDKLRQWSKIEL